MPRTTVDIDASILRELKKRQRRERKPLGELVSELLAKAIEPDHDPRPPFTWVAKDLRPRVDLEDTDAIWAILDKR
ncbi:MAG: antitoxin [Acidimicrobiales bacterium]